MRALAKLAGILLLSAPLAAPATVAVDDDARYTQAELDQMLAPIALYPDTVLSHVLIAATYPLEVVQAARWSREHPDLQGEEAVDAVQPMDWDPSVKALVAFPEILARMDEDLDWTERLGDAFLEQEGQVMDSVQHLRDRAYDAGRLDSLEHVQVIRERELIYIEPAISHIVYVPYYDPWFVYGTWWWPSYPPYCWRYWGGRPARYYATGFYWGIGFRVAPTFYFSSFQWHNHQVVVVNHPHTQPHHFSSGRDVAQHRDARRWGHDSRHRHGVAYRSERLRQEHGGRPAHANDSERRPQDRAARDTREAQRDRHEARRDQREAQRERHGNRREWGHDRGRGPNESRRREEARPESRSEPRLAARQHEPRSEPRVNRGRSHDGGSRWAPSGDQRQRTAERAEGREPAPARPDESRAPRARDDAENGRQHPQVRGGEESAARRAEPPRGRDAARDGQDDSARENRGNRNHGNESRGRPGRNGEERERGNRRGHRAER